MITKYYDFILEKRSNDKRDDFDVIGKVQRSKKLPKEMKDKIIPLIINGQTRYRNGKVYDLKYNNKKCGLGADKNGFFVMTHRARSKSYSEIDKIPKKSIDFVESTG